MAVSTGSCGVMTALAIFLWLAVPGCRFDSSGLSAGSDGDGDPNAPDADTSLTVDADPTVTPDAAPGSADACVAGCVGDQLQKCQPMATSTACPLGCNNTTLSCRAISPSNGANDSQLQDVVGGLIIPAGTDATLDTDSGELIVDGSTTRGSGTGVVAGISYTQLSQSVAVLGVASMDVGSASTLRLHGSRALIILSEGLVVVAGVVDASAGCDSGSNTCGGPGGGNGSIDENASSTGCAFGGNGSGAFGLRPETGGGGGSLGTMGARGGNSDSGRAGGAGGALPGGCPGAELVPLVGGSAGGAGGNDAEGGDGGGGGGALQITSFTEIRIVGQVTGPTVGIRASGGGGHGGQGSDGGGGGGSGGAILLEAPALTLDNSVLAANGGGGGAGGNEAGKRGENGHFGNTQAAGGSDTTTGGLGASSFGAATVGEGGGDDTGGGGGGAGIIRINVPDAALSIGSGVVISPAHTRADPAAE